LYRILPLKRKIQKQIAELQPAYRDKLRDEIFPEIERSPKYHPARKITKFENDLAYLGWHYDLNWSFRIHYKINDRDRTVTITYIGPHPKY
jgi:mRNA-degrading endonuclease RelE of RelBE toxin-antitoxin system